MLSEAVLLKPSVARVVLPCTREFSGLAPTGGSGPLAASDAEAANGASDQVGLPFARVTQGRLKGYSTL